MINNEKVKVLNYAQKVMPEQSKRRGHLPIIFQ